MDADQCRICLRKPFNSENMFKFTDKHEGTNFEVIFRKLTSFKIKTNEPQTFCASCKNEMIFCFFFFLKCRQTQRYLDRVPVSVKEEDANEPDFYTEPPIEANPLPTDNLEGLYFNEDTTTDAYDGNDNDTGNDDFITYDPYDSSSVIHETSSYPTRFMQEDPEVDPSFSESYVADFHCRQCPPEQITTLEDIDSFLTHIQTVHPRDPKIVCPLCGKLITVGRYKEHFDRLHYKGEKRLICDLCGVRFGRKRYLAIHMKRFHIIETPDNQCEVCLEYFNRKELDTHRRQAHPDVYPPFDCPKCDYTTTFKMQLSNHMLKNHVQFESENVKIKFTNKKLKLDHNESQDSGRKKQSRRVYKCKHCTFSSSVITSVLSHQVEVHAKKPKGKLKQGEIYCQFCSYSSKERKKVFDHAKAIHYDLDNNRLVNIEDTRVIHRCKYCSFGAGLRSNVLRHMKNLHGDTEKETYVERISAKSETVIKKLYCCKHCRYICEFQSNLKRHLVKQHDIHDNVVGIIKLVGSSNSGGEKVVINRPAEDDDSDDDPVIDYLTGLKQELVE